MFAVHTPIGRMLYDADTNRPRTARTAGATAEERELQCRS
jgi:hypothetical protein